MAEKNCTVQINGKEESWPIGTAYGEIALAHANEYEANIILVLEDGTLRELHKPLLKDCEIRFVFDTDQIGRETVRRSLNLLLLKSVRDVTGDAVSGVTFCFSISNGFYFTWKGSLKPTEDLLSKIKARMLELAGQKIPITKRSVSTAEAREIFRKNGMTDKEKLFRFRRVSKVNIYTLDDYQDYFYGFMVHRTGYLTHFDLVPYDEGFLMILPEKDDPTRVEAFRPWPKIFNIQKEFENVGSELGIDNVGDLNEAVCDGTIGRKRLVAEALQEARVARIAENIAEKKEVKFVLIAGPSSSGKTTFSRRLSIQLAAQGRTPYPISLDDYYLNRVDCPKNPDGSYDFETIEALDLKLLNQDLSKLLAGEEVELPRFNFNTGMREYKGDKVKLGPDDILIFEGIHGLSDRISGDLPAESKFRIYISALTALNVDDHNRIPTTDGRLLRRIVRDYRTRNASARETIGMWPSVRKGEESYIFPNQENADVMFNSALPYELSVLKTYAEPLLFQIPEDAPEYLEAKRLLKFLDYFLATPSEDVPNNSILREFIGGSTFDV